MINTATPDQYSTWVGLIYVFNLIVGTGALTLPAAFSRAGWFFGVLIILILAFISFITVSFVIETMASANAIIMWKKSQQRKRVGPLQASECNGTEDLQALDEAGPSNSDTEDTPLFHTELLDENDSTCRYYHLQDKIEMGEMATIFFNNIGVALFYLCITVYLYGDLSIYGTAIANSMTDVFCTYIPENYTCNDTIPDKELCWESMTINRMDAYHIFLTTFVALLGPFAFFNVQKTKYLQILTSLMRWLAFTIMIGYALKKLVYEGARGNPPIGNISGVPSLFGAGVYSFMCHHSLPALVAPISNKSSLNRNLGSDYILIASFYLLLALTGSFAFEHLDDLYTLDFSPRGSGNCVTSDNIIIIIISYFLALFPVFTLSTSFPVIAITLKNNLKTLFLNENVKYSFFLRNIFPFLAVVPPYLISMSVKNLSLLVGITGSFAGVGIQYLIPTFLVYYARKKTANVIGLGVPNVFSSPFRNGLWLIFVVIWAIACMALVAINLYETHFSTSGD